MKCSFCGKSQDDVAAIFAGPGVNICDECFELCSEMLADPEFRGCPIKEIRCSFCGQTQDAVSKIVSGPGVYICAPCIGLCWEILEDHNIETDAGT